METPKIELNLSQLSEGTLRLGEAPKIYDPTNVSATGTITAPADWVTKRIGSTSQVNPANANVVANYTRRTIVLRTDERSRFGDTITGTLEIYPDLSKIGVNANKQYTEKELYGALKFYGTYFEQRIKYDALIATLKKFEAKVEYEFQNADDLKGAASYKKIQNITTELDMSFKLKIPIFSGTEPSIFAVDICVGIESGAIVFWLESTELQDLLKETTDKIFDKELDRLSDFAIIKQW